MAKVEFDYYYGVEAEQFTFVRVPRIFFTDREHFGTLSTDAKILYSLLLERMSLSRKNNWIDEENRVFIIFKIEEIEDKLNCGHEKACNILKELDDENGIGLISKRRRGMGQPAIIYVKNFIVKDDPQEDEAPRSPETGSQEVGKSEVLTSENQTSIIPKNRLPEVRKSESNYIENNYTEKSYIEDQSIHLSAAEQKNFPTEKTDDGTNERKIIEQSVMEQIDYDDLMSHKDETVRNMVEEVKDLIVDVLCGERKVFYEGKVISEEAAKSAYRKLTSEHITFVLHNVTNYPGTISRIDRFLLAALYNAASTMTNSTFSGFEFQTGIKML